MIIDAVARFEERQWRNQLHSVTTEFVDGNIDLDSFVVEMYYLGFDNVLTQKVSGNE